MRYWRPFLDVASGVRESPHRGDVHGRARRHGGAFFGELRVMSDS